MTTTVDRLIFGTDPEFFLTTLQGAPVSASKYLQPADNKLKVLSKKDVVIGSLHRDNYVAEANTRPHVDKMGVIKDMIRVMAKMELIIPASLTIRPTASYLIPSDELDKEPDDVRQFGCNPSTNAYTEMSSVPEVDGATHPYRYAGGHLHFSTNTDSTKFPCLLDSKHHFQLVKLMDWLMGIPATYIWGDKAQFVRRMNYGRAGEYRPQFYEDVDIPGFEKTESCAGVEYRTLPPQIWNRYKLAKLFMEIGEYIIKNFDALVTIYPKDKEKSIQTAINTGKGIVTIAAGLPALPNMYNFTQLTRLRNASDINDWALTEPIKKKCCDNPAACVQCG